MGGVQDPWGGWFGDVLIGCLLSNRHLVTVPAVSITLSFRCPQYMCTSFPFQATRFGFSCALLLFTALRSSAGSFKGNFSLPFKGGLAVPRPRIQGSKKLAWQIGFSIFPFFQVFLGSWPFQGAGPLGIACSDPFPSGRTHPQPGGLESDLFLTPRNLVGPTSSSAIFSEPAVPEFSP